MNLTMSAIGFACYEAGAANAYNNLNRGVKIA